MRQRKRRLNPQQYARLVKSSEHAGGWCEALDTKPYYKEDIFMALNQLESSFVLSGILYIIFDRCDEIPTPATRTWMYFALQPSGIVVEDTGEAVYCWMHRSCISSW